MNDKEERYLTTLGVVLETVWSSYIIPEEIPDNIDEIVDNVDYDELLEEIKKDTKETEGIPGIHEDTIIAFEELKTYDKKKFEGLKKDMKLTYNYQKTKKDSEW